MKTRGLFISVLCRSLLKQVVTWGYRKDLNSLKSSLNGIETTMEQCEGDTLDQMKAAIMLLKFGRDQEAAWKRETTKLKEPPSTKVVVDFLAPERSLTTFNHSLIFLLASTTRRLYTEFLPPQHLAAVLLAPAQDTAWPGAMPTETGPQKKERPGQGPQSVLQLPSSWPQNLCLHQQRNLSGVQKKAPYHSA